MALSPVGIEMPADADCNGCHMTGTGTVGTKPIPVMGHPLAGWRDCTACHTMGSLVQTAPGHTSLHKDDCLICHQTRVEAGASEKPHLRPEHMGTEKTCSACHGIDDHAPLPEAMRGRGDNCWICHNGPEFTYLFEDQPAPTAAIGPAPERGAGEPGSGEPGSGRRRLRAAGAHPLIRGWVAAPGGRHVALGSGPALDHVDEPAERPARRPRAARCGRTRS